jgi:hypothetical protein
MPLVTNPYRRAVIRDAQEMLRRPPASCSPT